MEIALSGISGALNTLLSHSGMSEAELGRVIGVPRATINRITSGRTPDPRASTLKAIAEYFNVTVDQLLGNQPLFNGAESATLVSTSAPIPIIHWGDATHWENSIAKQSTQNTEWISADPHLNTGKFALKVQGDSMWPQFQENTVLIVDPNKEQKNRDFVIVHLKKNNEILFRQLLLDDKYKFIKAINDIFPVIQLQNGDKIIGVVIQTRNNLK
ncbi:MAG: hypothetical protein A3C44_00680 [Gammaproteobacteria bacterium RIFCSPHIGHO2_02_FULL_39_13]|nr:MAG: hypothetical protein A3C44_00680 [Gammaproteobacteria bacterium RIFCSPHIGHO2_02_FULL_39_13]OGT49885.1 MAG: hypothetical protein A3E53_02885 [Gammaproteobacteria bacterium RIFCSPHIGHO2_12_FULL_39_24]